MLLQIFISYAKSKIECGSAEAGHAQRCTERPLSLRPVVLFWIEKYESNRVKVVDRTCWQSQIPFFVENLMCLCVCIYTCINTHIYMYMCLCANVYTHICFVYIYMLIYTFAHIYIRISCAPRFMIRPRSPIHLHVHTHVRLYRMHRRMVPL